MLLNSSDLLAFPEVYLERTQKLLTYNEPYYKDYCSVTHVIMGNLARIFKPKRYGEIGSRTGFSASMVALACEGDVDIFCYDAPGNGSGGLPGSDVFLRANLEKCLPNRHRIYLGLSQTPSMISTIHENAPYDIFFIDGDHYYVGASMDVKTVMACNPRPKVVVIDDIYNPHHQADLTKVLQETIAEYNPVEHIVVHQNLMNGSLISAGVAVLLF